MSRVKGLLVRENWRLLNTPAPQKITTSAVQAISDPFGVHEILVRVDADTYIMEGTSAALTAVPVTDAIGHFMPADSVWPLIVEPGNCLGAISAGGNLYISSLG